MDEQHPLFDPEVRNMWASQGRHVYGEPTPPPGRNATFLHATRMNLDSDTHVLSPDAMGPRSRASSGSSDSHSWFSEFSPERARRNYGGNVYRVEPTGPFTDNFDAGQPNGEYASEHPLRIISKLQFGDSGPTEVDTRGSLRNKGA